MRAMLRLFMCLLTLTAFPAGGEDAVTEQEFRAAAGLAAGVTLSYRGADCQPLDFERFSAAMRAGGTTDLERSQDGRSATVSVRTRGFARCPSPYPPLSRMPDFDRQDLAGRRVTSAQLRGKPTLVNFYFAECKPCILEVQPLNRFARSRPDLNVLALTFDEPAEARAFVRRHGFRWRVVPSARDLIESMRVKSYPTMALFDAQGRLLGTRAGGVRDELEAAAVAPQLGRWVDGLLSTQGGVAR